MKKYILAIIAAIVAAITLLPATPASAAVCAYDQGWAIPKAQQYHTYLMGETATNGLGYIENCYNIGTTGWITVPGKLPGQPSRTCYLQNGDIVVTAVARGPAKWSRWQIYMHGGHPLNDPLVEPGCTDGSTASYLVNWGYR